MEASTLLITDYLSMQDYSDVDCLLSDDDTEYNDIEPIDKWKISFLTKTKPSKTQLKKLQKHFKHVIVRFSESIKWQEKVEPKILSTVVYNPRDKKVLYAEWESGSRVFDMSISHCCPEDQYDARIGEEVARKNFKKGKRITLRFPDTIDIENYADFTKYLHALINSI